MGCGAQSDFRRVNAREDTLQRSAVYGGRDMKSLAVAFTISLALTAAALAWTHGNLVLGNTFIADNSNVILTNDSGSDNLLAQ